MQKKNIVEFSQSETQNTRPNEILLVLLTSMLTPLISRVLILTQVEGFQQFDTERLLLLYYAGVSGYIISDKTFRMSVQSEISQYGFRIGKDDYISDGIAATCILVTLLGYESIFYVLGLITICIIAALILWKESDKIEITPFRCILIIVQVIITTIVATMINGENLTVIIICLLVGIGANFTGHLTYAIYKKRRHMKWEKMKK